MSGAAGWAWRLANEAASAESEIDSASERRIKSQSVCSGIGRACPPSKIAASVRPSCLICPSFMIRCLVALDLPFFVQHDDGSEVQLADAGLDLRPIADQQQGGTIYPRILSRRVVHGF